MVAFSLAIAVAGIATVLLAMAIALAGGWRQMPKGPGPVLVLPAEAVPDRLPAPLRALAWHIRAAAESYRAVLLIGLGLTPLGARFVHVIAPAGTPTRTAVAMLVIVVGAWGPPRLLSGWWLRQVRRSCPSLVRPRRPWRRRLVALLLLVCIAWSPAFLLASFADGSYNSRTFATVLVLAAVGGSLVGPGGPSSLTRSRFRASDVGRSSSHRR
jgi:hypothetical protein